MPIVQRSSIRLTADPRKVILRFLNFGRAERFIPVINYVRSLKEHEANQFLQKIKQDFASRHIDFDDAIDDSTERLREYFDPSLSDIHQQLCGAYFTHEYSIQSAALFNPSIVTHPDQSGMKPGELRFIMSLRAVGEGHISSLSFQTGIVSDKGEITMDPTATKLSCGTISNIDGENYTIHFPTAFDVSSRVIFPFSAAESNGMEDVRFVQFNDGGVTKYIGTYTAYNGVRIRPQLIETEDFISFQIRTMNGEAISDKGLALFPEKINGRCVMAGRQGGRDISIMFSDNLYQWNHYSTLQTPQYPWDMVQLGNCGSPVKTDQGWLLLTHAVGPMRQYVLSMTLLDLQNPSRVIATLKEPLMKPEGDEREGYVPNVLYTCGMMAHAGRLIIPYAMSDSAIGMATVSIDDILHELKKS